MSTARSGKPRCALTTPELDGAVVLLASIGEQYLADPAFEALFAGNGTAGRPSSSIHPAIPATSLSRSSFPSPRTRIEFVLDTTRAVTNLESTARTLERHPDIRFILSHAGGTIPYIAWRLAQGRVIPPLNEKAPQGAIAYLQAPLLRHCDVSHSPCVWSSLRELVDPSHILFGSDFPFLPEP